MSAARWGLIGGITAVFIAAIGMPQAFQARTIVAPVLDLRVVALGLVPLAFGWLAGKPPAVREGQAEPTTGVRNAGAGALAGLLSGVVLALFILVVNTVDIRRIFIHVSAALVDLLTFGLGVAAGAVVVAAAGLVLGGVGAAVHLLPERWRRPIIAAFLWVLVFGLLEGLVGQLLRGLRLEIVSRVLYETGGGLAPLGAAVVAVGAFALYAVIEPQRRSVRARVETLSAQERRRWATIAVVATVVVLAVLPLVLGTFLSEIFDLVGIFLLMGLGLNIVVGYAGLLDLGYVAFFAVGAYSTAVLTSPAAPRWTPELTFWTALPFVMLAAAFAGVLVGTPVLRMRGDYLAIVTLGFGEIARILFISDWLKPTFGGAQGITRIPTVAVGPVELNTPPQIFYPIAGFVLLAAYISWALGNSRIGRAWNAMREDEAVAEAMGVNIVTAKLSAFVTGAILASFSGALFASKIGAIFPSSFQILVSILVLVIIIVGGMGSLPGVAVGALVLVGVPELLREFEEFRFLLYGALLIFMMLYKPEGLLPSKRRTQELHQEEVAQDAWLLEEAEQEERKTPARAEGRAPDAGLT